MRPFGWIERKLHLVALQTIAQISRARFVTKEIHADLVIGLQRNGREFVGFSHGCLAQLLITEGISAKPMNRRNSGVTRIVSFSPSRHSLSLWRSSRPNSLSGCNT